ncbi:MAG: methylated-DNA-[protein]-cysteine S-methyltransferase, partial [Saprospiraceae bacterium]
QPSASQAVGQANGKNPIAIIIPCHRVIGSQGKLTGYAWGIENQIKLLQLERNYSPTPPGQLF